MNLNEKIDVQTTCQLPLQRLQDVLTSGLEGGTNYWLRIDEYAYPEGKGRSDYEFPHVEVPFDGGSVRCSVATYDEADDQRVEITREALERGLRLMAQKHPRHFRNIVEENDDAETGDVLLQLALLGEITFG